MTTLRMLGQGQVKGVLRTALVQQGWHGARFAHESAFEDAFGIHTCCWCEANVRGLSGVVLALLPHGTAYPVSALKDNADDDAVFVNTPTSHTPAWIQPLPPASAVLAAVQRGVFDPDDLPLAPSKPMAFCQNCGAKNKVNANFCGGCGESVQE
jgi:hypothetical protein